MAYNEHQADRIRTQLKAAKRQWEEKKMMGGLCFMVNGKMCLGLDIDKRSGQDRLMVRVGKLQYPELLQREDCRQMDFTGKPMQGYLYVDGPDVDEEKQLGFWMEKALAFNEEIK